jgi:hypothetical protein
MPTWKDAAWLLVLIANLALLFPMLPVELRENPAFEFVGKLFPWIGGGIFVMGAAWFREWLLTLSRKRGFNIGQAIVLSVLLVLSIPFVPIRPNLYPPRLARIWIDKDADAKEGMFEGHETRLWLTLGEHKFRIQTVSAHEHTGPQGTTEEPGKLWPITLSGWDLLHEAAWFGEHGPDWSLLYSLDLKTAESDSDCKIRIWRDGGAPDAAFRRYLGAGIGKNDAGVLEVTVVKDLARVELPYGHYKMMVFKDGCRAEDVRIPAQENPHRFAPCRN